MKLTPSNGDFTFSMNGAPSGWLPDTALDRCKTACVGVKPENLPAGTMRICGEGRTKYPGVDQAIALSAAMATCMSRAAYCGHASIIKNRPWRCEQRI